MTMTYLERNKGFLTWSKLKAYKDCCYKYKLMYVDGHWGADTKATILWTHLHRMCEIGSVEWMAEVEILAPNKRKWISDLPTVTNSEWVLLMNAYKELERQDSMELHHEKYEEEVELTCEYRWVQVKATMDRLDRKGKVIRDFKLLADSSKFKTDYFPSYAFWYDFQCLFYYVVCREALWIECDFIFDIVDKKKNAASVSYKLTNEWLKDNAYVVDEAIDHFKANTEFDIGEELPIESKCLWCDMYSKCNKVTKKEVITLY